MIKACANMCICIFTFYCIVAHSELIGIELCIQHFIGNIRNIPFVLGIYFISYNPVINLTKSVLAVISVCKICDYGFKILKSHIL